MTDAVELPGSDRFRLTSHRDPPRVIKRGDADSLRAEARALALLNGSGLAPRLLGHRHAELTMETIAGRALPLKNLTPRQGRQLGAALRCVHDSRRLATGGRSVWASRARSLAGYARRRLTDLEPVPPACAAIADVARRQLVTSRTDERTPFRMLHGDLTDGNILWTPRPVFIDWEFWRTGDPAEDLAYLAVLNGLPAALERAVLDGYGLAGMAVRVDRWRVFCALDAALWHEREGHSEPARRLVALARRLSDLPPE